MLWQAGLNFIPWECMSLVVEQKRSNEKVGFLHGFVLLLVQIVYMHHIPVRRGGQLAGVCSLLPPRGTQGSNSGGQAWLQVPLPSDLPHSPL